MSVEPARNNPANRLSSCAGAILAGGRSRRMGGGFKALLPLSGVPMLQRVIERVRPQVESLVLSVETETAAFEPFDLRQVTDPEPGSKGPLGGLLAALRAAAESGKTWLLLTPCDAPFLPTDLAMRLHRQAEAQGNPVAVAVDASGMQPAFSLWRRDLLPDLERAVAVERKAGFRQFLAGRAYSAVEWPAGEPDPFFNINDRAALEQACTLVARQSGSTT